MTPQEAIRRRRSVRQYIDTPLAPSVREEILSYTDIGRPLFQELPFRTAFLTRDEIKCRVTTPWLPQDILAIYTEDSTPARINIGYVFGLLDLYLQALGLGTCWLGIAQPREKRMLDGMPAVMMMAIGYPNNVPYRQSTEDFDRKPQEEITDRPDARLEPARLAPSAMNSQPWYFLHDKDALHVYCALRKSRTLTDYAHIDIGVALAHLAVTAQSTMTCFGARILRCLPGYEYMLSIRI